MIEVGFTITVMLGLMALRMPIFLAMGLAATSFAIAFQPIMQPTVIAQSLCGGTSDVFSRYAGQRNANTLSAQTHEVG